MCSNFGMNLHPGRKPCALQWEWYRFFTRLSSRVRRRFFPKALYMYDGDGGIGQRGKRKKRDE
jgi:hypothetical protein